MAWARRSRPIPPAAGPAATDLPPAGGGGGVRSLPSPGPTRSERPGSPAPEGRRGRGSHDRRQIRPAGAWFGELSPCAARASSARKHLCLAGRLGGRASKESEPLPRSIPTVSARLLLGTNALPTCASTIGCPRPIGPCPESTGSARSARARTLSSARGWWKAVRSPQGAIFPVPTSPIIAETQHGRGSATPPAHP